MNEVTIIRDGIEVKIRGDFGQDNSLDDLLEVVKDALKAVTGYEHEVSRP